MSIQKHYLKNKPMCKVTFRIPKKMAARAHTANLVGEFNQWSLKAHPMQRLKDGGFVLTLDLEQNRQYQFRYLMDGQIWCNEDNADSFAPTPYEGQTNSVISL